MLGSKLIHASKTGPDSCCKAALSGGPDVFVIVVINKYL